jgi:hypothetical protein
MKIIKMLTAIKKQKSLGQLKMTTAKDTGMQLTVLTKAQELCLKQFKAYHWQWAVCSKQSLDLAMAKHYRLHSTGMVLYLFIIHPKLYNQATSLLHASRKQYPNPLTSAHGQIAIASKFLLTLRQTLHQHSIHVEMNPLERASCYDPGPNFSFHTPTNYIPPAPAPTASILPPIYHAAPPIHHVPVTT